MALTITGFAQDREKETVIAAPAAPFTYQGKLTVGGTAANGSYDFIIGVYSEPDGDSMLDEQTIEGVQVVNGIFTVSLAVETGLFQRFETAYLDIQVSPAREGDFTRLTPRQQIGSTPYSKIADSAREADFLTCSNCITSFHIVNNSISPVKLSGVIPIEKGGTGSSEKNFVDLSTDQSVAGNKAFTGNVSSGGVFSGNGSGLTDLPASSITGTINTTQLAPETLPNSSQAKLLGMLRWDVLKPESTFAVGSGPTGVAFDGTPIWVTNGGNNNVTKLLASDGSLVGAYPVGTNPNGIAFDGTHIWVVNNGSSNVTKLRASDGSLVDTYPVGSNPWGVAFDGTNIWTANNGSPGTVTKLRASDGSLVGTYPVGHFPRAIAFDGTNIWVTNAGNNNAIKLRASDGSVVGTYPVGNTPNGIAFDGTNIWTANNGSSNVTKLRASDGSLVGAYPVSGGPWGIAFDGTNIWVTNLQGHNVTKLRANDGSLVGTYPVGATPQGIAFDGTNIWVANRLGGTVTRLAPAFPEP
ncbi:MAG: YncE family protein [Acidobacteria bacterium]|nr:YncE family protein [Acidobacteriota bacterium]